MPRKELLEARVATQAVEYRIGMRVEHNLPARFLGRHRRGQIGQRRIAITQQREILGD